MTERVMVDIETLGIEPGAAILSIGACRFDTTAGKPEDTFEASISLSSCHAAGLSIDPETLEWWLGQGESARSVLTGGDDLEAALERFTEWYENAAPDEIWANSPSFDCEHLEHAYSAVGLTVPWEFYEERDVRTIRNLPGAVELERSGTEHDALDDAIHQAREVAATLEAITE